MQAKQVTLMTVQAPACDGAKCTDDPFAMCGRPDPEGVYVCTRPKGHAGAHVACSGSAHGLKSWAANAPMRRDAFEPAGLTA